MINFLSQFRQFSNISKVKSAVARGTSVEVCFDDQQSLAAFLRATPDSWNIQSELKQEKLVTISPQFGEGHTQISDLLNFLTSKTVLGNVC